MNERKNMRSDEFEKIVKAYAAGLGNAGASAPHHQLTDFASIFSISPSATLPAVLKQLANVPDATQTSEPRLRDVAALLAPLKAIIDVAGASKPKVEVGAVLDFLMRHAAFPLSEFVEFAKRPGSPKSNRNSRKTNVREDLVESYRREFEETLSDEVRFLDYFRRLSTDSSMGSQELSALAKAVAKTGARSRDAALKKILARRQTIIAQKARLNATRGRSAA